MVPKDNNESKKCASNNFNRGYLEFIVKLRYGCEKEGIEGKLKHLFKRALGYAWSKASRGVLWSVVNELISAIRRCRIQGK